MAGQLPLLPAIKQLMDEVTSGPVHAEEREGPLAAEHHLLASAKKLSLFAAGVASQKYMQALAEEQEIIGVLSNLVMEVFGMESALLRARRNARRVSNGAESAEAAATRCFIYEAADRMETEARLALARVSEGDTLRVQLGVLRRFLRRTPPDLIGLRRQVANRALDLGRYPFLSI